MDHISHDSVEQLTALIIVIGGAIFLALSLRARSVQPGSAALVDTQRARAVTAPSATPTVRHSLGLIMAGLSAGAAVIHLVVAPSHFEEIGDLAAGFVISAAFQALWVRWCLAGPSRRTMAIGIVGNLAIVAAWTYTRTIGLPIGEFAGSAEPIGYPDGASVVFELLLVAGLIVRWFDLDLAASRRAVIREVAAIAVVPVLGLVLVVTSLATVAVASGLEHGLPSDHTAMEPMANH